jgi:hypothetical protein
MDEFADRVATSVLFENERIRVWEMALDPGQASDWHAHAHDYVFVNLSPARVSLKMNDSEPVQLALEQGFTQYVAVGSEGQARHQLVNTGNTPVRQVLIEFLGPGEASEAREPENNDRLA